MATKAASKELVGIDLVKAALLDRNVKLSVVEEDPEVVQRRMIEQILDATNIAEVWGGGEALHAADIVDRPFRLVRATFHNSEYEEGSPIFTAMEVAFPDTGEQAVVTSGALGVVARVVKLIEFGALPIEVRIRSSKTNSGYTVLDLEPVPDF
jgi:hypothetical protein